MKYVLILYILLFKPCYAHIASWYGKPFHGRITASGERYNMYQLTCASNKHKFGTKLLVTNNSNGKSVICHVNDTGNFHKYGRSLDLSYGAFKQIAPPSQGLVKVRIKVL